MKWSAILALILTLFLFAGCGDDDDDDKKKLVAADIVGIWSASGDVTIASNSCSLTEASLKDVSDYKVAKKSDTELTFSECEDDNCTKVDAVGDYTFAESMTVTNSYTIDASTDSGYDCKVTVTNTTKLSFSSATMVDVVDEVPTVATTGTECDDYKTALEGSDDSDAKDMAKLMAGDCTVKLTYKMAKE